MKTNVFKSEIKVQQYRFGQPFPDLYSEQENFPGLPEGSRILPELKGGFSGRFGIVLTRTQGFVLVEDGEFMQVSGPTGSLNLPTCIGRVPLGYKE